MDAKGIRADPKKIEKVVNFPRPYDVTSVKSCLSIVNFYRKFIKGCSKISKPLTELTKKEVPFM